jgi:AcrR family transcriptional regulator
VADVKSYNRQETVNPSSARDAKRLATRQRLIDAAQRLVAVHGYHGTTAAQIAEAAGVTERTFFRHFESKTDLFLANWRAITGSMTQTMTSCPDTEPLLSVVAAGLGAFADGVVQITEKEPATTMLVYANTLPVLALLETVLALETTLSFELARRLNRHDEDVDIRILANASVGVLRASIRFYAIGNRATPLPEAVTRRLEGLRPLFDQAAATPPGTGRGEHAPG